MGKLIPVLAVLAGLVIGAAAAQFLAPEDPGEATEGQTAEKTEPDAEKSGAKPSDARSHEFIKMQKQFVVPLLDGPRTTGLATVSLSLETDPGLSELYYAREPKLRDAFLQVLFEHANTGGFEGAFTRPGKMRPLRQALLEVAQDVISPDQVHAVLILDIARQDVF